MRQYYLTSDMKKPHSREEVLQALITIGDVFSIENIIFYENSIKIFPRHKQDKGVILRFNPDSKLHRRPYPSNLRKEE